MDYGKYSIMHEDIEIFAKNLLSGRKYRHNIETYRREIIEMAISKFPRKSEQIDYIIRKTTDEISTKLQKYNRKFLILSIMMVKELAYNYEKDLTCRHEIQSLTNFLLIVISNNYDEFFEEFVHIEFDEDVSKNIGEIIELAYLVIYSAVNKDHLFDCIDNYTILEITKNTLYPISWEEFFDNDYEKMNGKKKPEEYVIKNIALHKYIDDKRISMNYIKNELNSMFKQEYGFNITSIESLQRYQNRKRDYPLIVINNKRNDLRKYFNIDYGEKIFEILNCNIKGKNAYQKNILNYMELKPVFID
ncbi:hypothetical protein [Clostridium sp. C2-6-12]|uniref:hypothetical protein n=1 Tax=Clostridium sp. C2-6-12 TaxID=2698832 RepID=UPI00136D0CB8|nr:hypothetical protein [Clostridium sp. C2-6-12]